MVTIRILHKATINCLWIGQNANRCASICVKMSNRSKPLSIIYNHNSGFRLFDQQEKYEQLLDILQRMILRLKPLKSTIQNSSKSHCWSAATASTIAGSWCGRGGWRRWNAQFSRQTPAWNWYSSRNIASRYFLTMRQDCWIFP